MDEQDTNLKTKFNYKVCFNLLDCFDHGQSHMNTQHSMV